MAGAERRPLTDNERRLLRTYASGPWRLVIPLGSGFLFFWMIAYFAASAAWRWLAPYSWPQQQPILWATGLLAAAIFVPGVVFSIRQQFSDQKDPESLMCRARKDLAENTAVVETFGVTAAVEIVHFGDEGTGFFLALDDGRVLFVRSQDLDAFAHDVTGEPADGIDDERHKFPQTRIAYTYAPLSGISLDIVGVGEPLRPRSLAETTDEHCSNKDWELPEDGTFYDGPLEAVLARFNYPELPVPPDPPQR